MPLCYIEFDDHPGMLFLYGNPISAPPSLREHGHCLLVLSNTGHTTAIGLPNSVHIWLNMRDFLSNHKGGRGKRSSEGEIPQFNLVQLSTFVDEGKSP